MSNTPKHLNIIQINMARSAAVNDQVLDYCLRNSIDIALLQEPYTNRGKLTGFEVQPMRCFLSKGSPRRGQPRYIDYGAAIVVFNPDLRLFAPQTDNVENFVSVDVDNGPNNTFTLISGYFKYRQPTILHVSRLESLLEATRNPVLIALDSNAFSTRWYSRINDARGAIVEDFIAEQQLICHNRRSPHTTFHGARGRTNIDITLSSIGLANCVGDWVVIPDETSSDHNIIRWTLDVTLLNPTRKPSRFSPQRADWDLFRSSFLLRLNAVINPQLSVNEAAEHITRSIVQSANLAIPKSTRRTKISPPWWNRELSTARRELKSHSRALKRADTVQTRTTYNTCRNKFTNALRKAKRASWRLFCTSGGHEVWGKVYKWLRKTNTVTTTPTCLTKTDGSTTTTLDETIEYMLNSLIPNDVNYEPPPSTAGTPPFARTTYTPEELHRDLSGMAPSKAPGLDCITVKMIKMILPYITQPLVNLINKCLAEGTFPDSWKNADVVAILKAPDRNKSRPNSYRPISLLPALSKPLEKAINNRLLAETSPRLSNRQFGFTKNRSTEDAISNLITWCQSRREKHVLTVFLDISGAFDNLNWTALLKDLNDLGASQGTIAIIRDYLLNRTATLTLGGASKKIQLTRGCPQGSILGPSLWNSTMEALLRTAYPEHVNVQAYADDIAVSVAADTRIRLINLMSDALVPVSNWGHLRGLKFSSAKSEALIMKGGLEPGFTIPFGDNRIRSKPVAKYLGIWISSNICFNHHIDTVCRSSIDVFTKLRGTFGHNWGMKKENLLMLYKCVFLPKICYGARFWANASSSSVNRRKLYAVQRRTLLGITGAYKTVSTDALQVLAGTLPLDLEVKLMAAKKASAHLPFYEARTINEAAKNDAINEWQQRWTSSSKGRWTFGFFPSISDRLKQPIWLNHYVSQFLTGHGDFREKLASFHLVPSPLCPCGDGNESVEHVLFSCRRFIAQRQRLELACHRAGHLWPCPLSTLVSSKSLYTALVTFSHLVLERK